MNNKINQHRSSKTLSQSQILVLAIAFCLLVPLAGAFAETLGGWIGFAIWFAFWLVITAVAIILIRRYANPNLPTVCGIMVGITGPKPSDSWLASNVGEAISRGLGMFITVVSVAIALWLFRAISMHGRIKTAEQNAEPELPIMGS